MQIPPEIDDSHLKRKNVLSAHQLLHGASPRSDAKQLLLPFMGLPLSCMTYWRRV